MADIPLRTYVQQLDNLIERKQVDEVVAHCRHILGLYPKHLDTYRMLGKALLEKGRHGDAADIFQRVLSVVPDDFIAHVGMSIVREDEANLDAAIWHMERAFESAPANGAIQQELCRLYGRRDGVAPTKARLTRGALARMYAQGGLYLQAEAELKAALGAEADRVDLLTKLADVYWQTDQPAQAAQTSAAVLQKLPYSLEANRILVNVFRSQGRAGDAGVYRQRLEALDPYEAFADPAANGSGAARVEADKVSVARLEYVPGMEESGSPDWLASIGAKFEEPPSPRAPEAQPEWLSSAGESPPPASDYQPGQSSVPDWLKDLDSGPAGPADSSSAAPPDWLKDIATPPAPQTGAAAPSSDEGLPDWLTSATGPLPADAVPDWMLQDAGPTSLEADTPGTAPLPESVLADLAAEPTSEPQVGTAPLRTPLAPLPALEPSGEVPDWLKASGSDDAEEELPDWLKAITNEPQPEAPVQPVASAAASLPPATIPDWLQEAAPEGAGTQATSETVPAWLNTAASAPADTSARPDWLKVATGEIKPAQAAHLLPHEAETATPAPILEASAAPAAAEASVPAQAAETAAAPTADTTSLNDLPDWLKGAAEGAAGVVAAAASLVPAQQPAAEATPDAATPPEAEAAPDEALAAGQEMPAWLKDAAPAGTLVDRAVAASEPAASTAPAEAELPDWLQSATAAPEQSQTPVWLQTAPSAPSLVEQPEQEPELEVPDWLKDISAGAPAPDAGQPPLAELGLTGGSDEPPKPPTSSAVVDLPDYLQMASPEAIARAEQPLELEPEELQPEEDEPAAALPAEIPDWLKALAPTPDPELPAAPAAPAAAEAPVGVSDSLSWMDELTAPAAPAAEQPPAEPAATDLPDWLAAPAVASDEVTPASQTPEPAELVAGGLAEDTLTAEIPPWAQNDEPGPSDTIVSWLAGKHVPDWLRQPANDAPGMPAVEWEANAEPAAPAAVDSLTSATEPDVPAGETPAPAEAAVSTPDLESMDPEAAFAWLESLAAQQGARPEELLTTPAEPAVGSAAPAQAPAAESPAAEAAMTSPATAPAGLEEFLRQNEAALPVEHLLDTAPSKARPPAAEATPPLAETPAEPALAEMDEEAAMRWLEGLAAQQGAKAEELLTAPEDRTLEAPQWVAAELSVTQTTEAPAAPLEAIAEVPVEASTTPAGATSVAEPPAAEAVATPTSEMSVTPAGEAAAETPSADDEAEAAMRWLEGLAAQQGAKPEELLTAPEERTLETPAWISAQAAEQAATAEPAAPAEEPSPFEALAAPEPEPAAPEPEPAAAPETPEWLKAAVLAEDQPTPAAEPASPAEPAASETPVPVEPAAPATSLVTADLDKLSRLAERLAASRRAREAEMEARFAEQRNQQEAARRWMEDKMESKPAEAESARRTTGPLTPPAVAEPAAMPAAMAEPEPISPPTTTLAEAPAVPVAAASEALTTGQAALTGQDYATAVTHLSAVVEQGQHLDTVVRSLEDATAGGSAPVPVLRLLGDAYVRTDQLQKALDTYRQALRRLKTRG
jgi:tetratricopeptide (TPR) repeat protein